jgi:hypothetical protein
MSQTTESLAFVPEQKGPGGAAQNLPTDRNAAPGRTIAAAPQPDSPAAAMPQQPDALAVISAVVEQPAAARAVISAVTEQQAAAVGLAIRAEASWPESAHDHTAPSLPGFIVSTFSPIAAETATRCLGRRAAAVSLADPETSEAPVTAVVVITARGDRESAGHVARTVAAGGLLGPLLFFQSVPNAVAGHIAARWKLTGPVVCLADPASALEAAALLIEDGDADEALLVRVEQGAGGHDQAHAVLLSALNPALIVRTAPGTAPGTAPEIAPVIAPGGRP